MTGQFPPREFFDPFARELSRSPFDEYARLHEQAPIHWNLVMHAWVLTRYEDVRLVLTSEDFEATRTADILTELARRAGRDYRSLIRFLDAALFFRTGAAHIRGRRTLAKVMNRVQLSTIEPQVREMARRLAAPLAGSADVDAVSVFTGPLPQQVMALILDLPGEDVPRLSQLLSDLTLVFDPASLTLYDRLNAGVIEALDLLAHRIDEARRQRSSSALATIFTEAAGDDDAEKLENAAATALFMYRVGAETTIGLLGAIVRAMVDHPELREQNLRDSVGVDRFIAELLRLESNVQRIARQAKRQSIVGGVTIEAGQRLVLLIGAANRDPLAFPSPGAIAIDTERSAHLAFGAGDHFCLGAGLARMEARVALDVLLGMKPLERAGEERWYASRTVRRLVSLPVRVRQ